MSKNVKKTGDAAAASAATRKVARTIEEDLSGAGNLLKVRDILFGGQLRDIERSFNTFNERLARSHGELEAEMKKRSDELESRLKHDVEELSDKLKAEAREREDEGARLAQEIAAATRKLEKHVASVEDLVRKTRRELEELLKKTSGELSETMQRSSASISQNLDHAVDELRGEKADKSVLAELLMNMAVRLNSQSVGGDLAGLLDESLG